MRDQDRFRTDVLPEFARTTITWHSASSIICSEVVGPKSTRAQFPCGCGARTINTAPYLLATFSMTVAAVPSSITQVADASFCCANVKKGWIFFDASSRSASATHGGEAGPKGITLG